MSSRFLTTVTGRAPGDHVCWPFHGVDELVPATRAYVAEGLERHERVMYLQIGLGAVQQAVVSDVAQVGRPRDHDRPVLTRTTVDPRWTPWADPVARVDTMTRAAVADGYTGLRVLTDVTHLVRSPEGRRQWVRAEHRIDRYVLDHPLVALCGYDVDHLGEALVAEGARLHALTRGAPSPFLLRAADAHGGLALSGEVDAGSAHDVYDALTAIAPELHGPVTLDLTELEFIDHAGLAALDRAARSTGALVHLVGASRLTAWLVGTLGLTGLTIGAAP